MNKLHLKHFQGPDKAIYVDDQILIKGPLNHIFRLVKDTGGYFFEHKHLSELKALPIYPPGDAALLTKTSKFYR